MTAPPADPRALRDAQRREARRRRAALAPGERRAAALAVRDHLLAAPWMRRARRVAAYLAQGSELDLGPTIAALQAAGTQVFLPRLAPGRGRRMDFLQHHPGGPLQVNRHGIAEPPADAARISPRFLQVVLLPLVAFDAAGTRLGSGVGYYDRCFGFRLERSAWHAPLLVGIGFACQAVAHIPRREGDVPLDRVMTEAGVVEPPAGGP